MADVYDKYGKKIGSDPDKPYAPPSEVSKADLGAAARKAREERERKRLEEEAKKAPKKVSYHEGVLSEKFRRGGDIEALSEILKKRQKA